MPLSVQQVLRTVTLDKHAYFSMAALWRSDPEVCLQACTNARVFDPLSRVPASDPILAVPDVLADDKDFTVQLLLREPEIYAFPAFRRRFRHHDDRDVLMRVLVALEKHPRFTNDSFGDSPQQYVCTLLGSLPASLPLDDELVVQAQTCSPQTCLLFILSRYVPRFAPSWDLQRRLVAMNGSNYEYTDAAHRSDPVEGLRLAKAAISARKLIYHSQRRMDWISSIVWRDRDFCLMLLRLHPWQVSVVEARTQFMQDPNFVRAAVTQCGDLLPHLRMDDAGGEGADGVRRVVSEVCQCQDVIVEAVRTSSKTQSVLVHLSDCGLLGAVNDSKLSRRQWHELIRASRGDAATALSLYEKHINGCEVDDVAAVIAIRQVFLHRPETVLLVFPFGVMGYSEWTHMYFARCFQEYRSMGMMHLRYDLIRQQPTPGDYRRAVVRWLIASRRPGSLLYQLSADVVSLVQDHLRPHYEMETLLRAVAKQDAKARRKRDWAQSAAHPGKHRLEPQLPPAKRQP